MSECRRTRCRALRGENEIWGRGGGKEFIFSLLRTDVPTCAVSAPSRGIAGTVSGSGYLRESVCACVSLIALIVEGMLQRDKVKREKRQQAEREGGRWAGCVSVLLVGDEAAKNKKKAALARGGRLGVENGAGSSCWFVHARFVRRQVEELLAKTAAKVFVFAL